MTADIIRLKPEAPATIAKLRNVALFTEGLSAAVTRPQHLPGIVVFHGPRGFGKTLAATYGANIFRAHYVRALSRWTARAFCLAMLHELGDHPERRVYEMADQIIRWLGSSGHPLIIGEGGHVLAGGLIEIVRDIHDGSGAAVAMIGEEQLPAKLRRVERVHNRVLRWVPAMPVDVADARELAAIYCRGLAIEDDLLVTGAKPRAWGQWGASRGHGGRASLLVCRHPEP